VDRRPRTNALPGVSVSTPAIHFGIPGLVPGLGRLRHWRTARRRKSTPSTIFPHEIVSAALLLVDGLLWSAIT